MTLDNDLHKLAHILLVEDNIGDIMLTKRAFKTAKIHNQLTVAESGEAALELLQSSRKNLPDLVLLDLNLQQMSGQDVLKFIKSTDYLMHIPVLILSSSKAEQDVIKSYNLHASGYVIKPIRLNDFAEAVQKIEDFWFNLVVLPNSRG